MAAAPDCACEPRASSQDTASGAGRGLPIARPRPPSGGFASALALPASPLVRLPIGDLEALRLALAPAHAGSSKGVGILSVEQQDDALIRMSIGRHRRAIDEKTNDGAIRIV